MAGKATQSLERSLKRQRTLSKSEGLASAVLEAAFQLDTVFDAINATSALDEQTDAFPSISWPIESFPDVLPTTSMPSMSRKRSRDGMMRSKTFKTGLADLVQEETSNNNNTTTRSSNTRVFCSEINKEQSKLSMSSPSSMADIMIGSAFKELPAHRLPSRKSSSNFLGGLKRSAQSLRLDTESRRVLC